MSGWGTNDGAANRIKQTYVKGFLDISGGALIVEKSSSLQIKAHDSDKSVIEFKSDHFTVNTTSAIDVSYSSLATLGLLGVSFEQSTEALIGRVKYITSDETGGVFSTSIGNDDEQCSLQVYGLIKGHYGLDVDGNVSFNNNLDVDGDSSFNSNLQVAGNLYVAKRSVFTLDVSMNGNLDVGSGSSSVAINKDISAGIALDVSGVTVLRNTLYARTIDTDISSGQIYLYDSLRHQSGNVFINNNGSSSATTRIGGGSIWVAGSGLTYIQSGASGSVRIGENLSTGGTVNLGSAASKILVFGDASFNANARFGSGSSSVSVNKDVSAGFALDVSGLTVLRNTLYVLGDVSFNNKLSVGGDSSLNGKVFVGGDLSLNSNLYVSKRALFSGDVSINANARLGSGSSFIAVNKDISAGFALDVSGLTILRNTLYVASDVSIGTKLFVGNDSSLNGKVSVGGDLSLNSNLYVSKRALFSGDVSINANARLGSGSSLIAVNKDISAGFALDVSGLTVLRNTLYVASDVSMGAKLFVGNDSSLNGNVSVGGDLSLNSNLYVSKRALFSGDVSINANARLGSGSSLIAVNKDISAGFALDVSGLTVLRNTLYVASDVSMGAKLFVGNDSSLNGNVSVGGDLSLNSNLYVSKRALFSGDVSMNANARLGSGSSLIAVNKDISAGFALDVSGLTVLRNALYVFSDVSFNNKLSVGGDLSLNGKVFVGGDLSLNSKVSVGGDLSLNSNLYVSKRALFSGDVSMNANARLGSGSSSVAVNKDISGDFALDVSGATILRNTLSVRSNVTFDASLSVANISEPTPAGDCNLWTNSTGGAINIGTQSATGLYLKGTTIDIQGGSGLPLTIHTTGTLGITNSSNATAGFITGDKTVAVNIGTGNFTTAGGILNLFTGANDSSSRLNIGTDTNNQATINVATGSLRPLTSITNIGGTVYLGSRTSTTTVSGGMIVINDVSLNKNVKMGSGSSSVAINKDISGDFALDVSGLTVLRNPLYVLGDVSFSSNLFVLKDSSLNGKVSVGGDLSLNSNLYVSKRSVFTLDVSMLGNLDVGSGSSSLAVNKDISAGIALDVSGLTVLRNTLYVFSDVSFNNKLSVGGDSSLNGKVFVGGDLSLNSNLYVSKRSVFTLDVSMLGNLDVGSGSSSVAVNKDISAGFALDVSGLTILRNTLYVASDVSMGANLFVGTDSSLNGKVSVGGDLSLNSNLYVSKRALFSGDVSINANARLGSGSSLIAVNKDISAGFALDVSGLTILRNTLYVASDVSMGAKLFVGTDSSLNGKVSVGGDLSLNSNLYVSKRALFSGDVSMNANARLGSGSSSVAINKDISGDFALDVSGATILRNTLSVRSNVTFDASLSVANISEPTPAGDCNLWTNSTGGAINIGAQATALNLKSAALDITAAGAITVNATGIVSFMNNNRSAGLNIGTGAFSTTNGSMNIFTGSNTVETVLNIGTGQTNQATINVATGSSRPLTSITNIGGTVYLGSRTSTTTVSGGMIVINDVSLNKNVKMGSGSSSVSINKDISGGFALDVSGATKIRGAMEVDSFKVNGQEVNGTGTITNLTVTLDSSLNGKLSVGQDLSVNGNLYVAKRSVFTLDVSMLGNLDIGSGSSSVAINKDISAGIALDVSGVTKIRGAMDIDGSFTVNGQAVNGTGTISTLTVTLDSSLNGKLSVGQDLSVNGNLYVAKRALFSGDVSINANARLGSGSSLIAVNKDITAGIALDVSGLTVLRNALYVFSDVSFNNKLSVGGDVSFNNKLSVSGDVSFNNKLSVGGDVSFNNKLSVSGDVSFNNKLSVSGDASFNNKLSVRGDVSFNQNLSVGQDLSLNGNLYVSKRALFLGDVSLNKNVKMGSGSSSVAINKDISGEFALDVNGMTKFRGAMDVVGNFTINGVAPVSSGSALTGNIQVGTNSGFVTVDKPYFYLDPLLTIYYDFDTAINGGTQIKNIASASSTYDGVLNIPGTPGSTTGMIDTTVFYNGKQNNTSIASFKNDPALANYGIRIGQAGTSVPVSSIMSFSFWVYKKSRTVTTDFDRVFHFTDATSIGQAPNENNTIALDISSGGNIFPVITKGGGTTPISLITPSLPIVSYDLGASTWNHVVWTINGTKSSIYINGSLTQNDTLSENITLNTSTTRNSGAIAYTYTSATGATRDFSGNIDDFRYYNGKALNYAEIYQLYNNSFYTFDICGGFLANGSSVIYEPVGSKASANSGSLTLLHGDASGSSSIMFKSVNDPLEYGYIQYEENSAGSTGYHYGLMTIGIENDMGTGAYTSQADRISLFPSGGTGFVGVNTKAPRYSLDVSGTLNTNADASINGVSIGRGRGNVATNTAVGFQALNVSGPSESVAVGYQALNKANGSNYSNHAFGYQALSNCQGGTNNTGIGYNTLQFVTSVNNNTAIGRNAGNGLTTAQYQFQGNNNTFLGMVTGISGGNWVNSTAVGYEATITESNQIKLGTNSSTVYCGNNLMLQGDGDNSYIRNTTTNTLYFGTETYNYMWINSSGLTVNKATGTLLTLKNTNAVYNSSQVNIDFASGTSNFFLGQISTVDLAPSSTYRSKMSFKVNYDKTISSTLLEGMVITGKSSTASDCVNVNIYGNVEAVSYNAISDYRMKENMVPLNASFTVDSLNPITYNLKSSGKQDIGFIAHEVQEVYPFLVSGEKDGKNTQSLNYNGFIGILTKEIQVMKKKVSDQEARIVEQERKALEQEAQLAEQSAKALEQETRIQALEKMMMNK